MTILAIDNLHSHAIQRGVLRVFLKTVEALTEQYGQAVLVCSQQRYPQLAARQLRLPPLTGLIAGRQISLSGLQSRLVGLVAARERPAAIYSPFYGRVPGAAPQLCTVYDMIVERFPEYFPPARRGVRRLIAQKRRCLEGAALLLAISATTARDVRAFYPQIDPARIVTIPLGVDEVFFSPATPFVGPRPYLLFAGNRGQYKNFAALVHAYARSGLAERYDLRVFSPGPPGFSADEQALIRGYGLAARVLLADSPPDEQVRDLYAGAAALVYPSLCEGFGFPLLEAMACGTLVAAADSSSLPEVGGDAALYFDPRSVDGIAAALVRVAGLAEGERAALVARGRARAAQFTWRRFKERTAEAFRPFVEAAAAGPGGR